MTHNVVKSLFNNNNIKTFLLFDKSTKKTMLLLCNGSNVAHLVRLSVTSTDGLHPPGKRCLSGKGRDWAVKVMSWVDSGPNLCHKPSFFTLGSL